MIAVIKCQQIRWNRNTLKNLNKNKNKENKKRKKKWKKRKKNYKLKKRKDKGGKKKSRNRKGLEGISILSFHGVMISMMLKSLKILLKSF